VGKGSEHLIRASLQAVGGDPGLYERAWAAYQRHYDAANGRHAQVYPGAIEGLTLLRARGVRMACVTNKPGRFARDLLQAKDLLGFFEHVFGGDAFAQRKPHPLPLIMAGQALQAEPAHTLMVGDSSNDAQAAPVCYTGPMFIHRTALTGRSDRGAWPWRQPASVRV